MDLFNRKKVAALESKVRDLQIECNSAKARELILAEKLGYLITGYLAKRYSNKYFKWDRENDVRYVHIKDIVVDNASCNTSSDDVLKISYEINMPDNRLLLCNTNISFDALNELSLISKKMFRDAYKNKEAKV